MSSVLVDSNVLLDVVTNDPVWEDWSSNALASAADDGLVVINPIIYAEASLAFGKVEDLDLAFPSADFVREPLPWDAAFLAARSYRTYRRRGGVRRSPLPDFYIGAHAAVAGYRLLTRDAARYRTYFPTLQIITPE